MDEIMPSVTEQAFGRPPRLVRKTTVHKFKPATQPADPYEYRCGVSERTEAFLAFPNFIFSLFQRIDRDKRYHHAFYAIVGAIGQYTLQIEMPFRSMNFGFHG